MKATGIVRRVDSLGRVVIPKEMRRVFGINMFDPIEFYVTENSIVLRKYTPGCIFCNSMEDLIPIDGKQVCMDCFEKLQEKAG
jgi:transcriptional pleiotropic regulator of transition state genes